VSHGKHPETVEGGLRASLRLVNARAREYAARVTELERERDSLKEALTAARWAWECNRFHAFDAIRDDACPCCGGRVAVEGNGHGSGLKLRAVR
jgi:hypothetical protein